MKVNEKVPEPVTMLLRRVVRKQLFFLFESCLEGG